MIKTYEKIRFTDENKLGEFFIEVNWNPKDKKTNECQVLRFTFPDGKEILIKRDHFIAFLFAIGKQEDQKDMVPYKTQKVRQVVTTLGIKAQRDIAKGEMINVPINLSIPLAEEEVIARR